jgi:hypothetical protein
MLAEDRDSLTALAFAAIAFVVGALTWLCVGWFGDQPVLIALVAVLLAEVCLAGIGVIFMLLAERMTVSLMAAEKRPAPPSQIRPKPEPIWFRLPEPVPGTTSVLSHEAPPHERQIIAFPPPEREPSTDDLWRHKRAA